MSRLLRAEFSRLFKSRIFWIGIIYALGIGALSSTTQYREMVSTPGYHPHIDNILYSNCLFMPIVAAVFVGLFVGTDYSDGTIRNKLMIGHTRTEVYFSNLFVCMIALFIIHLVEILAVLGIGVPLVGNLEMPVSVLVKLGLISLVTLVALTSIYLLISMLIQSKANASVTAIVLSIVFLMSAMVLQNRLNAPKYYEEMDYTYTDEDGNTREYHQEREMNRKYLSGTKREIYEFLYDVLPGCQMLQMARQDLENPGRLPLYSLAVTVVTTACGVCFFRRKNLN